MKKHIMKLWRKEIPLSDVIHYLIGNYRYALYYTVFRFLLRKYIKEQIYFRILVMDKECYEQGECKLCGCSTTALQMCNKSCDKLCYPEMMSKAFWKEFQRGAMFTDKHGTWCITNNELKFYNNEMVKN